VGLSGLEKARVDTLFDTGATRNAVSKEFLRALLQCDDTSDAVVGVDDIDPIEATGLSKSSKIVIRQVAWIRVSFWEDRARGKVADEVLGFCVTPNSSEDLLIGKPSLDLMGFVSDKFSIELRILGVRFPSVLPAGIPDGPGKHMFLTLSEHVDLVASDVSSRLVELAGKIPKGDFWLLPGPDLPADVFLSEGPCVVRGKRAIAELTSLSNHKLGPSTRVAELRPLCDHDTSVLRRVGDAQRQHVERFAVIQDCHVEANRRLLEEAQPGLVDKFMATSYKTRGKKERQEQLFPELVKEAEDRRNNMTTGVVYPDQDSSEYREKCKAVASKNLGKQLSAAQVARFLTRVVAAFSCVLWMDGCHAPRVEGFEVDLKLKEGAVPKVQQPFPLSRFDQLRLELHEDEEVSLGKARWGGPGEH